MLNPDDLTSSLDVFKNFGAPGISVLAVIVTTTMFIKYISRRDRALEQLQSSHKEEMSTLAKNHTDQMARLSTEHRDQMISLGKEFSDKTDKITSQFADATKDVARTNRETVKLILEQYQSNINNLINRSDVQKSGAAPH